MGRSKLTATLTNLLGGLLRGNWDSCQGKRFNAGKAKRKIVVATMSVRKCGESVRNFVL